MSLRRSVRLQIRDTQDTFDARNKPPAVRVVRINESKRRAVQSGSANGALSSLPPELLHMIVDNITSPSTMSKLGRTCQTFYSLTMPLLHNRIAVAAMFHAHIPKLIRALEPYLTIAQKRQLKTEGRYKGQQERYPNHLDVNAEPACASYVRQVVVGVADPGRKHEYIVHRYAEEAFKNLNNLEIVEASFLTESMAQSIVSLKNLQALRLLSHQSELTAITPLAKIKNLKHLSIDGDSKENNVVQSILLNSTSTLRSLIVKANPYATRFLHDWENEVSADDVLAKQKYSLTALKSFTLCYVSFDPSFIKSLQRAIDFMRLHELTLGPLSDGKHLFFQHLTSLAVSAQTSATGISLRSLCLEMEDERHWEALNNTTQTNFEAKCRLISAFNTLTSLQIKNYNQYPDTITTNPGLSDMLLQAIIKHKNLTSLKISYIGIIGGRKIPYLSATTVAAIVDNLPQLRHLEFAPEEAEITEIGAALSRGANLTSITCFPHDSWARYPRPDEPGLSILIGIVNGFLSHGNSSGNSGRFIWEDHFKLDRVSVTYRTWQLASNFTNREKGMKKAEKIKSSADDGQREVLYREISGTFPVRIHVGYDPDFTWVEKVAKDLT